MKPLLETRDITVAFGSLIANDRVNFTCPKGAVVSLLGENGAGKTTLMKVIYGMYMPKSGSILFEGETVSIRSPRDAIHLGIQMVHQHFMLVDHLTVAENVVMGAEPKKFGLFQRKQAEAAVCELSEAYGLQVDPTQLVSELSVGTKQRVEIIKALYHGAKLLILDEPTAVLTPQETQELFKIIRRLVARGIQWSMPSEMAYQWLMYLTQMSSSSESGSSFEHSIRFTVWSKIQSLMTAIHSSVFWEMSFPQNRITVHPR